MNLDGLDSLFARIGQGGNVGWYLEDRLGSVRDMTDGAGVLKVHLDYDSWGAVTAESGPDTSFDDRYQFTRREWDSEIGLQYSRGRTYSPELHRWLQQDPLGFSAGDVNLSRYVSNAPTNHTDPTGEIIPILVGVGIALGGIGGLLYTAERYNHASDHYMSMSAEQWTPEAQAEYNSYVTNTRWIGAASQVAAVTGISMVAAPVAGFGAGYAWAAWGTAGRIGVGALGVGGLGLTGYDAYTIARDWNQMDGPERFGRIGSLVGPLAVGGLFGPRYFRAGLLAGRGNPAPTTGLTPGVPSSFSRLRQTVRFLRQEGVNNASVRRSMIRAGFEGSIGSDTPVTLARFRHLFPETMQAGKRFSGRLGDIGTRVATINEALGMERAGLNVRFEFGVSSPSGRAWVDLVGLHPTSNLPVRAIQFIRALPRLGGIWSFDSRERLNARIIQEALGPQFPEFIITGP